MPKTSIFAIVLVAVFCFAGCNWFGAGSGGSGGGGGQPSSEDFPDDRVQQGSTGFPSTDYDSEEDEQAQNEARAEITQGIRATYIPKADETTDDAVLQTDRDKFNENAALQYEIVARAILYELVGHYGETDGAAGETITYEFFADTSLLPSEDATETTINLEANTPYQANNTLLEGWDYAIEQQISGLSGSYNENTNTWTVERTYSTSAAWNFSLGTSMIGNNYNDTFVNTFTPYVQINLMEYFLNLPITPLSTLLGLGTGALQAQINEYVAQIDKLGINANQEYADFLYTYIIDVIVGSSAMNRETASFTYDEPMDTYEITVPGENPDEPETTETITVYYDMDGTSAHTFTSSTIYKYNLQSNIRALVDKIAGTYDTSGNVVTPAISAEFPTYTRLEITDIAPEKFFTSGTTDEISKLDNMDYREYTSVVWYPDGIQSMNENFETVIDTESKIWQFDYLTLMIDSQNDITLDIYLRLHINGENHIAHITRINTDSTQSFDYEITPENEKDENGVEDITQESFFLEDKTNLSMVYIPLFLPDYKTQLVDEGITNAAQKTFYNEENAYKNTFAGKLGSSVAYGESGEDFIVTNHYGETVDLSSYALCADSQDFVEVIFVPQRTQGEDYDYSFKFLINDMILGEIATEEN